MLTWKFISNYSPSSGGKDGVCVSLTFKMAAQDQLEKGVEGEGCFLKRDATVWVCGNAGLVFALQIHAKVCICLMKAFRVPVSTGEIILCGIVCATGILLRVGTFVAKCLQKRRLLFFKLH